MASKRRKAAAAAATEAEELRLRSPARRSSRSKSSRRKAAPEENTREAEEEEAGEPPPASPGVPPETCLYKTPKRTQAIKSRLPTFSSPANEGDIQQEIFWDPQSPIVHKLDSEQKRQTVNRHTVEISEIVNRIAPQDEKPTCCEGSLLGFWIGDDAIPCTPAITKVRSRTKVNGARGHQLKHSEEELLKLAKQFDKNLTDAIQDQNASCCNITHTTLETGRSTEHEDETGEEKKHQSLEEYPKANTTLPFGAVDGSTKALEPCEDSRQEPLDLDAEIALRELFDCPTQKCSGRLSQGLSDCSSNTSIHENQSTLLEDALSVDNITAANKRKIGEAPVREDSAAPLIECIAPVPTQKAKEASEQTAPKVGTRKIGSVVSSKVDQVISEDFDDWGDDSFLMQITQNPELISTENVLPLAFDKNGERKEKNVISDHGTLFNSFKNDPTSSALQKQSIATGNTMTILPHNITIKAEKIKSISVSGHPKISCSNPIPVKPEDKSRQEGFTQLKCPASSHFPEKRAAAFPNRSDLPKPQMDKYGSSMSSMSLRRELPKNNVLPFGDWNEPKFSKDVLDLCSESDSLWGTRGEEDDDLLYQVCDDVEKNTVSHEVVKESERSPSKLEVGPCLAVANQGISNCPQTRKTHVMRKTFSLDAPVTLAALLKSETSTDLAQDNWRPFKTESISHIPEKWCRSHSVHGGHFGSGSASAPLFSDCQNGLRNMGKVPNNSSINQLPMEKSKYVFKKTNHSQDLVLDNKSVNTGSHSGIVLGLGENKNAPNISFRTAIQTNTKPPFKRHLSDCFAQYETEQKGRKCSQEEIARKKQEALERRKCKMQALLKNTAPT